tara:strand:- start:3362 stop:3568 length:207 start_codon:yes stop_codon:yes gene_type:complete
MRIINIVTNQLIIEKQKLENELERILNNSNMTTDDILKNSVDVLNKLTQTNSNLLTWESYINKEKEKN